MPHCCSPLCLPRGPEARLASDAHAHASNHFFSLTDTAASASAILLQHHCAFLFAFRGRQRVVEHPPVSEKRADHRVLWTPYQSPKSPQAAAPEQTQPHPCAELPVPVHRRHQAAQIWGGGSIIRQRCKRFTPQQRCLCLQVSASPMGTCCCKWVLPPLGSTLHTG